jgi:hypothetical protein
MTTKISGDTGIDVAQLRPADGDPVAMTIAADGKVAFPQVPSFLAGQASATTFTLDTFTKVKFDSEVADVGGNYDPVLSRFVVPVTGAYLFCYSVSQGNAITGTTPQFAINLRKNGDANSVVGQASAVMLNNSFLPACAGSTLIRLTAGDYVEVFGITLGVTGTPMISSFAGIFSGQWMGN